ncbi:hypothetical protein BJX64DRAFT_284769 [Aspergillus heterothallicus]
MKDESAQKRFMPLSDISIRPLENLDLAERPSKRRKLDNTVQGKDIASSNDATAGSASESSNSMPHDYTSLPESLRDMCKSLLELEKRRVPIPLELMEEFPEGTVTYQSSGHSLLFDAAQLPFLDLTLKMHDRAAYIYMSSTKASIMRWGWRAINRVKNWFEQQSRPKKNMSCHFKIDQPTESEKIYDLDILPNPMVDYCVLLKLGRDSPAYQKIASSRKQAEEENELNFTNCIGGAGSREFPICLPYEVLRSTHQEIELMMGPWQAAHWWYLLHNLAAPRWTIKFLPGILIRKQTWELVASILDSDNKPVFKSGLVTLGSTDSVFGGFKMSMALEILLEWARDEYWPAFEAHILGLSPEQPKYMGKRKLLTKVGRSPATDTTLTYTHQ